MSIDVDDPPERGTLSRPDLKPDAGARGDELIVSRESEEPPTISVVMPTLNEEDGIAECIQRVKNALVTLEVTGEIIVSDSSTDATPEIARAMDAHVVRPDRPGYGYAYRYAFERARGEYVVMGDADCTYDFEELPTLLGRLRGSDADIVMGSRLAGEIRPGSMPALHKYVGNPLLTAFLNVFYDAGVSDAHSGFRVFRREIVDELELSSDGMEFASEMVMEAAARGYEVAEVPITYHPREGEATLNSFEDGWRHVRFMLLNAPGYLFSVPGVLLTASGLTVMALSITDVTLSTVVLGLHSLIAGSLLTIMGVQVVSLGVFSSLAGDPIRKPDDPLTKLLVERVTLERGATVGLGVFAVGASYATAMIVRWVQSGFVRLPFLAGDVVALTAIVLGVQIVFGSFFMSILTDTR